MPMLRSPRYANSSHSVSTRMRSRAALAGQSRQVVELRVTGRLASRGFAVGPIALLSNLAQTRRPGGDPTAETAALQDAIASALRELARPRFLATDWSHGGGIALTRGSPSGHVATLARARSVPMIVGIDLDLGRINSGCEALIDGDSAVLCLDPAPETRRSFATRRQA